MVRLRLPAFPALAIEHHVGSASPAPWDVPGWQRGILTPAGATIEVTLVEQATTETGWPFTLIASTATAADGLETTRLHAFYRILDQMIVVVLCSRDPAALAQGGVAVAGWLRQARVSVRGEEAVSVSDWLDPL
jgi:hypothetical protein